LGSLALLQDTAAAVPYSSWTIRPTEGLGGAKAVITIHVRLVSSVHESSAELKVYDPLTAMTWCTSCHLGVCLTTYFITRLDD
jgi:hypothetical protein